MQLARCSEAGALRPLRRSPRRANDRYRVCRRPPPTASAWQFGQDIPIWERKLYLTRPLLCDGDGAIAGFRRWATQFYSAAGSEARTG